MLGRFKYLDRDISETEETNCRLWSEQKGENGEDFNG